MIEKGCRPGKALFIIMPHILLSMFRTRYISTFQVTFSEVVSFFTNFSTQLQFAQNYADDIISREYPILRIFEYSLRKLRKVELELLSLSHPNLK